MTDDDDIAGTDPLPSGWVMVSAPPLRQRLSVVGNGSYLGILIFAGLSPTFSKIVFDEITVWGTLIVAAVYLSNREVPSLNLQLRKGSHLCAKTRTILRRNSPGTTSRVTWTEIQPSTWCSTRQSSTSRCRSRTEPQEIQLVSAAQAICSSRPRVATRGDGLALCGVELIRPNVACERIRSSAASAPGRRRASTATHNST
jgi:hypothetical protein